MADPKHLQLFNAAVPLQPPRDYDTFPLFSQLPYDIREDIWKLSMSRERMIRTELKGVYDDGYEYGRYIILVRGRRILSKIFHVNHESRHLAKASYRVRLPCRYDRSMLHERRGLPCGVEPLNTLCINPEWDTVLVDDQDNADYLVWLLADARAADAENVGLLNLAFGGLLYQWSLTYRLEPFTLRSTREPNLLASFRDNLGRLKNVYFVNRDKVRRLPMKQEGSSAPRHMTFVQGKNQRSRPVGANVPGFQRVGRDPRAISSCLEKVYFGPDDPRFTIFEWLLLLRVYRVQQRPDVEHRVILTCQDDLPLAARPCNTIVDQHTAKTWIADEESGWRWSMEMGVWPFWNEGNGVKQTDLEEMGDPVETAIGFWIIPIEAFGPMPRVEEHDNLFEAPPIRQWDSPCVLDLSNFWPELALANIF